jgi:regulator of sigma E protease
VDLIGLIPNFGNLLFTLAAFVAALSIIVAIHEYGHYIVGRWSGIHAEVFSLGFGPVIWSRRDRRGTVWQLAALPFGGYVKFLGDANAASGPDAERIAAMPADLRRRTMHAAPLWARASTVAAGPLFNFILSMFIFAGVFLAQGSAIEPPTVGRIAALPAGAGDLREGDRILSIAGQDTPDYAALYALTGELAVAPVLDWQVDRDGRVQTVQGPWPFPPLISAMQPGSPGTAAGLMEGDVILSVDGQPLTAFRELQDIVAVSEGRSLQLQVWRAGAVLDIAVAPRRQDLPQPEGGFETRWLIGLTGGLAFEPATEAHGPVAAVGMAAEQIWFLMRSSISGLWHMITGAISSCNLSGPIGIAEASGDMAAQGVESFIWFVAVLSTAVGLLNLFPIPVLDGGHLVFHAWEAVTGRPPSDRALRVLMGAGLTLILSLMLFALTNDIFCP